MINTKNSKYSLIDKLGYFGYYEYIHKINFKNKYINKTKEFINSENLINKDIAESLRHSN